MDACQFYGAENFSLGQLHTQHNISLQWEEAVTASQVDDLVA